MAIGQPLGHTNNIVFGIAYLVGESIETEFHISKIQKSPAVDTTGHKTNYCYTRKIKSYILT